MKKWGKKNGKRRNKSVESDFICVLKSYVAAREVFRVSSRALMNIHNIIRCGLLSRTFLEWSHSDAPRMHTPCAVWIGHIARARARRYLRAPVVRGKNFNAALVLRKILELRAADDSPVSRQSYWMGLLSSRASARARNAPWIFIPSRSEKWTAVFP